jgi:hypothetical protein
VFAILLPKTFYPQQGKPAHGFKITQKELAFLHSQSDHEKAFFDEDLEDISDDNTNESERKCYSLWKSVCYNTSFVALNFADTYFKRVPSAEFSCHTQTSHYLFTRAFRI